MFSKLKHSIFILLATLLPVVGYSQRLADSTYRNAEAIAYDFIEPKEYIIRNIQVSEVNGRPVMKSQVIFFSGLSIGQRIKVPGTDISKAQLTTAFQPEVKQALDAVSITNYWKPIVSTINKNKLLLGLSSDINPDLENYVTNLATTALFTEITERENNLRSSLANRNTELLKKVFNYAENNPAGK